MQRGEHIKKPKGRVRLKDRPADGELVKNVAKREADYEDDQYYEYEYDYEEGSGFGEEKEDYYDGDDGEDEKEGFPFQLLEEEEPSSEEGGVISFNDIETECPADTVCVERFFCAEFSGNTASDQIVKHFYVHQMLNIFNWIMLPF